MKKYAVIILSVISILSLIGCGHNDTHEIKGTVPAENTEVTFQAAVLEIKDTYISTPVMKVQQKPAVV